jgi:PiT family inorganic phosphate transporter
MSQIVIGGMLGAIVWSSLTLWLKIPSSISQSLVGGLIGAVWVGFGVESVKLPGLYKTLVGLFLSPVLGLFTAFWLVRLSYGLAASATPHVNRWFNRGQVLVSILMAISFGANDGQKVIAMLTMGLLATGLISSFTVPTWVVVLSALAIGLGTLTGGWRLIHTLGGKFYKIRPIHGLGAQLASGGVLFFASLLGAPVSGSQVVTSAIVGAGSADRIQKVRWGVVQNILIGWLLTIPMSGLIGALAFLLIERIIP